VTAISRGFMLGATYLPGASFVQWNGRETLTPARSEVVLWRAP
jgi:hypothetical protein